MNQFGQAQANYLGGAADKAPTPKDLPAHEHAKRLHQMAEELEALNSRLENFADRLLGSRPESAGKNPEPVSPNGALLVAQFGAQKITGGLDRLRSNIARLEEIA